jgi:DNA polymerase III delta prime subunit
MKIIALIMLTVFALDMLGAIILMHSWVAAVLLVLAFAAMWLLRPKKKIKAQAVGWYLGPAVELTNPDRPERIEAAYIAPRFLNLGLLLIGGPGSGKTIAALAYINSLKTHSPGCGWVNFEGKGDVDIYKMCVAMGSAPDHFFSSELPGSDTINLFAGEAQDVIDRLGKVLIGETTSTSFYSDEQRAVLARVIPLLRCLPEATNLRDLYVTLSVEDAGNELLHRAKAAGANAVDIELAKAWFAQPLKDRLKNVSGLLNRLFIFVNGPYADRLNAYQPDIDIATAVAANESIYLHLPLTSFARDVAIAIIETFGVVARTRQLAGTENLKMYPQLYDDWGAFFHAGFGPYSARCRSAAMPLSFGFQSRAQLDAVGPTFADELDDTIANKVVLRVQGTATADYAVTLLGEYDTLDVGTGDSSQGENGSNSNSLRYVKKARIDQRQLRELQAGEAYVSTLATVNGQMVNPLWKLRVPMPKTDGWQQVPLPAAKAHEEGEGLSFWNRYMNPAKLAEINAAISAAVIEKEKAQTEINIKAQGDAKVTIENNPGFTLN